MKPLARFFSLASLVLAVAIVPAAPDTFVLAAYGAPPTLDPAAGGSGDRPAGDSRPGAGGSIPPSLPVSDGAPGPSGVDSGDHLAARHFPVEP